MIKLSFEIVLTHVQRLAAAAGRLWQTAAFRFVSLKTYSRSKAQFHPTRQFGFHDQFQTPDIHAGSLTLLLFSDETF